MQFSGTDLTIKRSFYTQTGVYGFGMACTVDNTTGRYYFGLSGVGGDLRFTMQSGKIYYGAEFIHTYRSNQQFLIEGQFTTGRANVIKDHCALIYGEPKASGAVDTFYFQREIPGAGGSFDVQVSGNNLPVFSTTTQGYLLSSGQNAVTGWFLNLGAWPVRVFQSDIQASQNYSFGQLAAIVAPASSGAFAYSGDFSALDISQPILTTFHTNYNDYSTLFSIIDARTFSRFVYLTGPTDFTFNTSNVLNRDLTYLNYSGGFVVSSYNANLVFQLAYVSGLESFTGVWSFATGVSSSALVSLKVPGQYSSTMMSGSGSFAPNSTVNFQVSYVGVSGNGARLIISGAEVLNPISQSLAF